jgi:hypothetical protein
MLNLLILLVLTILSCKQQKSQIENNDQKIAIKAYTKVTIRLDGSVHLLQRSDSKQRRQGLGEALCKAVSCELAATARRQTPQ